MKTTKKKAKGLAKHAGGRPTSLDKNVVAKLESIFKLDVSIEVACNYAGIHKTTYHRNIKTKDGFATRMTQAQNYGRIAAGNVVMDAIVKKKDVQTAKWWLEKKHPKEFGGQPALQAQQTNVYVQAQKNADKFVIEVEEVEEYE